MSEPSDVSVECPDCGQIAPSASALLRHRDGHGAYRPRKPRDERWDPFPLAVLALIAVAVLIMIFGDSGGSPQVSDEADEPRSGVEDAARIIYGTDDPEPVGRDRVGQYLESMVDRCDDLYDTREAADLYSGVLTTAESLSGATLDPLDVFLGLDVATLDGGDCSGAAADFASELGEG